MTKTCYLYDPTYLMHDTGFGHPETANRLTAIDEAVKNQDWYQDLVILEAKEADFDTIALVHDEMYIRLAERECNMGYSQLSTGDTTICPQSYKVALKAVGGVMAAVDAVLSGVAHHGFCAVRPPGHHANQAIGMGFCMFNNIAIAARYAQHKYGLERILIADWDVHHGNGTQDIFYHDNSVLFMSTHQSPWYPGTGSKGELGAGKGKGFTINRPFPGGTGNREIIDTFRNDFLPAAQDFQPDLVLLSAGFDSHARDPLGYFNIDDDGFRELTKIILEMANLHAGGKCISILEGGYSLENLASVVPAHLEELVKG